MCYVHNIFIVNLKRKVFFGFNLNPPLKLLFFSLIIVNNNLLIRIYCKYIVHIIFLFWKNDSFCRKYFT